MTTKTVPGLKDDLLRVWPFCIAQRQPTAHLIISKKEVSLPTEKQEKYQAIRERDALLKLQDAYIDLLNTIQAYETYGASLGDSYMTDLNKIDKDNQEKIAAFAENDHRLEKSNAIIQSAANLRQMITNLTTGQQCDFTCPEVLKTHQLDNVGLRLLGAAAQALGAVFATLLAATGIGALVTLDFWATAYKKNQRDGQLISVKHTNSEALAEHVKDALTKVERVIGEINKLSREQAPPVPAL